jgi:TPR repeat protein
MGAEKGDPIMQTYLGGMYGLGAGGIIPIDMVESYAWYMAAQYQGIKGNGKLRETYQAAMGSETFAKAEKKAKQYQDAYSKPFPEFRNR